MSDSAVSDEKPISAIHQLTLADDGRTLAELSMRHPLFVVLLRHAGCTFHREALEDLKQAKSKIEKVGAQLVILHMREGENPAESNRSRYNAADISHVSDPDRTLYQELSLPRGKLSDVLGWKDLTRGFSACVLRGHGVGSIQGDPLQLGGMALLRDAKVVWSRALASSSERPDYAMEAVAAMRHESVSTAV